MPYQPKFCCECGEKIERVDGNWRKSRRFCDVCATDYPLAEKIPLIVCGACLILGIAGFANFWRAPEKTLTLAPNQFVSGAPNANRGESNQTILQTNSSNNSVSPAAAAVTTTVANSQKEKTLAPVKTEGKTKTAEILTEDPVFFCGAPTKKGTPCSRRVKGGGRCWQHEGQTALLPPEKLRVQKN